MRFMEELALYKLMYEGNNRLPKEATRVAAMKINAYRPVLGLSKLEYATALLLAYEFPLYHIMEKTGATEEALKSRLKRAGRKLRCTGEFELREKVKSL